MQKQRKKQYILFALLLLCITAILFGVKYYLAWTVEHHWSIARSNDQHIIFPIHSSLLIQSLTEEDQRIETGKTAVVFKATEQEGSTVPLLFSVRKETGLRIVTSITHVELLDGLLSNIEKSFPQKYPDFKKEAVRIVEFNGHKAAEFYFTYTSPKGVTIKQRFLVVAYDDDTAYYIAAQSEEKNFADLNRVYFDRMFNQIDVQ